MPHEIEIKLRVAAHDPIRAALARLGAQPLGTALERNTLFDTPDRRLYREDRGLRVRTCRPLDEHPAPPATLTSKGPRLATAVADGATAGAEAVKTREEHELVISDGATAGRILEQLGLRPTVCFEKRREGWDCESCLVTLDELPELGCFVEIEGPTTQHVTRLRASLGLEAAVVVEATYVRLVAEHVAPDAHGCHVLRFGG